MHRSIDSSGESPDATHLSRFKDRVDNLMISIDLSLKLERQISFGIISSNHGIILRNLSTRQMIAALDDDSICKQDYYHRNLMLI
jgi:hypothetical protein